MAQQRLALRAVVVVPQEVITELLLAVLLRLQRMVAAVVVAERVALARLALQARAVLASQAALAARLAQVAVARRLAVLEQTVLVVVAVAVKPRTTGPLVLVALAVLALKITTSS